MSAGIDVERKNLPDGREVMTARVVLNADASGGTIVQAVENLEKAIDQHAYEHDHIVTGDKIVARFYYKNAAEAFDDETPHQVAHLQRDYVFSLRMWRFVTERLI